MTRTLSILTGIILALNPLLAGRFQRGTDLNRPQLSQERGGDKDQGSFSFRCDGGLDGSGGGRGYVGCSVVGGTCTQCVTRNPDGSLSGSMFERLRSTQVIQTSGYMYRPDLPNQNCGTYLNGICVVDPTPGSSGFTCSGSPGASSCGVYTAVREQPFPIADPPGDPGGTPMGMGP